METYFFKDTNLQSFSPLFTPKGTAYSQHGADAMKGAKPMLVFIHGVGMKRQIWHPQIEKFSQDFNVVTYDTLGHGESPLPPRQATMQDYLNQLYELIETLGAGKIYLAGHSMGALIALGFALQYPQHVTKAAILMGVYNRTQAHRERALKTANDLMQGKLPNIEATLSRWFTSKENTSLEKSAHIAYVRECLETVDKEGYARAYSFFANNGEAFVGLMPNLKVETLFLTASGDPNSTPEMSKEMSRLAPKGRYCMIENERHMAPLIAHSRVNGELMEFFKK